MIWGLHQAWSTFEILLATGRASLVLDELHQLETRVQEAVDAVGEAGFLRARETGGRSSTHTPVFSRQTVNGRIENTRTCPNTCSSFYGWTPGRGPGPVLVL